MITKKNNMGLPEIMNAMINDKRVRLSIVKRSHKFFFYFYFPHYAEYEAAPFHDQMFHITEEPDVKTAVILGFRGCGKSTVFTLSFPLFAILGEQKIKYVLILSKTQQKAQMMLQQIKYELETNELLKKDLGPFQEERNGWNIVSLTLPKYNAKIVAASTEQSIRGYRHMQYRPQLIIADDLEDLESVKTQEGREKVYNWLTGDVIPAGTKQTRLIIVGSLLHNDSLIKRLQKEMEGSTREGVFKAFPFFDDSGATAWLSRFPDEASVKSEKQRIGNEIAWQREYMLKVVPEEGQVVTPEMIRYYDYFPNESELQYQYTLIGIDFAISQKESGDFTAMIGVSIYGHKENLRIFIHPHPVNEKLSFQAIQNKAKFLSQSLGRGSFAKILVEEVGIQSVLTQELAADNFPVQGCKIQGDKRERLSAAASLLEQGKIYFPRQGAEELVEQLLGFGSEKHDDLCDAFSMLIIEIIKKENGTSFYFSFGGKVYDRNKYGPSKTESQSKPGEQVPNSPPPRKPGDHPWRDENERKAMELQADLDIIQQQNPIRRNYFDE